MAVLAAPRAFASKSGAPRRVGLVPAGPLGPRKHQWDAFVDAMRQLGWREGQNIAYVWSVPKREGEPFPPYVEQAVRAGVEAVVVSTTAQLAAAQRLTSTLPVVGTSISDPIGSGFAKSLSRPGGNITGVSLRTVDLAGKRVETLLEALPRLQRIVFISPPGTEAQYEQAMTFLRPTGVAAAHRRVASIDEIHRAIEDAARERAQAVMLAGHPFVYGSRLEIAATALRVRLPVMGTFTVQARDGFLLTYGTTDTENYRRASTHVHRILNGVAPGNLPIEQIDRVELGINLRTARALGIEFPQSLLVRADEVFQ